MRLATGTGTGSGRYISRHSSHRFTEITVSSVIQILTNNYAEVPLVVFFTRHHDGWCSEFSVKLKVQFLSVSRLSH